MRAWRSRLRNGNRNRRRRTTSGTTAAGGLTGAAITLLCLVTAALAVATGEKRSDLGLLHGGVTRGSIFEVEIEGLPRGDSASPSGPWVCSPTSCWAGRSAGGLRGTPAA